MLVPAANAISKSIFWITRFARSVVLVTACVVPSLVFSDPVSYDITVKDNWFDADGTPFDMPLSPTLTGTVVVDSDFFGSAGLVSFSLTTGTQTWTEADYSNILPENKVLFYTPEGDLENFSLYSFAAAGGRMYISSNNNMGVEAPADPFRVFNACNGCVSFAKSPTAPPQPPIISKIEQIQGVLILPILTIPQSWTIL